jgi:hypothetical protein
MEDRRGGKSLVRDEVTDFLLPKDFAIQVQRGGVDRAAVKEVDKEMFTITRDGGGGG